jgi:hypothetical protein
MTQQYLRRFSAIVGSPGGAGIDFTDFYCNFVVRRGDNQTPNSCDLRIYNLADNTANKITNPNEFTEVVIQAGYAGNYGIIFNGTIKQVRLGRVDQKDSYVDITAADGDEAYNFAPITASLAAGSKPGTVAGFLLDALKVHGVTAGGGLYDYGYAPKLTDNGSIRGQVLYGMARDKMRDFAFENDCAWSIQDGKLTLIPFTSYIPGTMPLVTPQTGLIGVPEATQQGIKVRVLLNPFMRIGTCFVLKDATINQYRFGLDAASLADNLYLQSVIKQSPTGQYYIMNVAHSGNTRGNEWYTDIVCLAADASIPASAAPNALFAVAPAIPRF